MDYKKLPLSFFEDIFSDIKFKLKPMWHQYVSLAFALDGRNQVAYFHDIGTGKTLAALYTIHLWNVKKTLVVCPRSAFSAWQRDIIKYTNFTYIFLDGTKKERMKNLSRKRDIYIINYEGLKCIYAILLRGLGWQIIHKSFINNFDCIIYDEVHKTSAFGSLQSKICYQLSTRAKYIIGLTGTPIKSELLNLWGVFRVIDLGRCLGDNFYQFRRAYFKQGMFTWYPKKGSNEKILNKILPITISFKRQDCFDLPDIVFENKFAHKTTEYKKLETDILNNLSISFKEGTLTSANVLNKSQKLMQLIGGFIYIENKDGKQTHRLKTNSKLKVLDDCIKETNDKVLIFHQYVEEGRIIEDWCIKNKIKFCSIRGETKDKLKQYKKFVKSKSIKAMIAHPMSAGESFDFSVCSVVIFYSNGGGQLSRKQAIGRVHRKGQKNKCVVIDIILKDSVDEIIIKNQENKKVLAEKVLMYIREHSQ